MFALMEVAMKLTNPNIVAIKFKGEKITKNKRQKSLQAFLKLTVFYYFLNIFLCYT
jgi:hypothetical protein